MEWDFGVCYTRIRIITIIIIIVVVIIIVIIVIIVIIRNPQQNRI